MFTFAVIGSRDLTTQQEEDARWLIESAVERVIVPEPAGVVNSTYQAYRIRPHICFISGGARGVDTIFYDVVYEIIEDYGYCFEAYLPTVQQWSGPGGFEERNRRIAEDADELLCIQSRQSKTYGAGWTYDYAKSLGKMARRFWV